MLHLLNTTRLFLVSVTFMWILGVIVIISVGTNFRVFGSSPSEIAYKQSICEFSGLSNLEILRNLGLVKVKYPKKIFGEFRRLAILKNFAGINFRGLKTVKNFADERF